MRIALAAAISSFAATAALAAGPVGPTRPSEIVTLAASFVPPTCADGVQGARLDTRVTPEGTYVPLEVPPKRVLVLTELRWSVTTTPNVSIGAFLRPGPEQSGFGGLLLPGARTDENGRATGEAKLEPGVVLRNPVDLCVRLLISGGGTTSPGNLTGAGYFAKDR